MRKTLFILLILVVTGFAVYRYLWPKKQEPSIEKLTPLSVSSESDAFDQAMADMLKSYFSIKDALVAGDRHAVATPTKNMYSQVAELPYDALIADETTLEVAHQIAFYLTKTLEAMQEESSLENLRQQFQQLSDSLFDLMRTTRHTGGKIYRQYCPMAFDNTGAYWISNSIEVLNPYFGDAMLHCGSVTDSLNLP